MVFDACLHPVAGLDSPAGLASMGLMSHPAQPDDVPREAPDERIEALLALRDELRTLNARLEYFALMLRLTRAQLTTKAK